VRQQVLRFEALTKYGRYFRGSLASWLLFAAQLLQRSYFGSRAAASIPWRVHAIYADEFLF